MNKLGIAILYSSLRKLNKAKMPFRYKIKC